MSRSKLKFTLALSLLLNAGFIGAVGYQVARNRELPSLFTAAAPTDVAAYLKLSDEQRGRWHELEADFVRQYEAHATEIAARREKLIRTIFSDQPAAERIEAEREAIARIQTEQQRRVIAQLLREREILDPTQRAALAEFLLLQGAGMNAVERAHRK